MVHSMVRNNRWNNHWLGKLAKNWAVEANASKGKDYCWLEDDANIKFLNRGNVHDFSSLNFHGPQCNKF